MIFIKTRGWFWRQQYIYTCSMHDIMVYILMQANGFNTEQPSASTRPESCTVISFIYNQQVTPFAPALLKPDENPLRWFALYTINKWPHSPQLYFSQTRILYGDL